MAGGGANRRVAKISSASVGRNFSAETFESISEAPRKYTLIFLRCITVRPHLNSCSRGAASTAAKARAAA